MSNIYLSSDLLLTVDQLIDAATGLFIEDADSVSAQFSTVAAPDTPVGSAITLINVVGSTTGKYQGTAPNSITFVEGSYYYCTITVTKTIDAVARKLTSRLKWRAVYHPNAY